jgi:hypothetical protein
VMSRWRRGKNHDKHNGLCRRLQDLIEEKNKNKETRAKKLGFNKSVRF